MITNREIINENESNQLLFASSFIEKFGRLFMKTLKDLVHLKIVKCPIICDKIYYFIINLYFTNRDNSTKINTLMKCIPQLKLINKRILQLLPINQNFDEKKLKNLFFIKICLDVYECYYKDFENF